MKIVILMGSPRKKDSLNVCKEIEKRLGSDDITYDYIFLKDYDIQDCKGCGICFKKSELLCPCKDDIYKIRKRLIEADGIIFATPVYAYQVPAPLKRIIDRMAFLFHRQELVGKPTLIVVTSDGGGHKQVSKYMKMTVSGWGCNLIGSINIISPMYFDDKNNVSAWGYDEYYHTKMLSMINKSTDEFKKILHSDVRKVPSFYDIFMFNCLRSKTFTSQADYDFWKEKGWLDSNYFYETKLNIAKKVFGAIFKGFINLAGKRLKNKISNVNKSV
ncbi:flavodoxin family protein [Inconstantimicrobium mannanitabidum]|uniref:Fe-S cluster protein n=1 Tax=Inconstantimicrobium mannanitabidum TaxID=1604901 RepID=A0ACB5R7P9_9CLOT|nr:NAD(P)H-dependent oxidoreductase [Clostridium sp. TW13]GKX64981.1 Fe-S cluster protein [Clostridium sp. TW13]